MNTISLKRGKKDLRICLAHSGAALASGGSRVALMQALLLQEKGNSVLYTAPYIDEKLSSKYRNLNLRSWCPYFTFPILSRTFNRLIHTFYCDMNIFNGIDVIITHNQPSPYVAYKANKHYNIPYIAYLHAPVKYVYPRKAEVDLWRKYGLINYFLNVFPSPAWWRKVDLLSVSNAGAILTNSEKIANRLKTVYGREAIVCHPGTDKGWLDGGIKTVDFVKKKYGLGSHVILVTNRHVEYKKLHLVPTVLKKVKREYPDAQVVITGRFNPTYTPRIINEAVKQGVRKDTILTNIVSDEELAGLYNACQAYLYTAIDEDWGLGIIEAMYCSKPAICWKDAGAAYYINDGINGFALNCYDLDQMAETTSKLFGDKTLQQKIGDQARATASQFSWKRHLQILVDTINNLVLDS